KPQTLTMASENEGRSKSRKNKGPKKPPQRGLGVEQLERMRTQEALRKMAEASGVFNIDHHHHHHHQQHHQQQQQQVLLRYGALSSNVPFQFPQQQMMINENNNNGSTIVGASAFGPYKNGFGVGTCSNVASGWFLPNNQHNNKPTHFGSESSLLRNPLEPSKDSQSQSFDLCLKKTRLNEEENVTRGSIWSNHVHDFHNKLLFKHDESVEIVAVHRRGNSSSGNGRVLMEYKFFPRKDERDTVLEQEFPTIDFGFGEASSSSSITVNTSAYGGGDSSNGYDSIDLSLKL
ncbi:uncharacterized protein LOC131651132, partial [Vicia villosa]|uniref:uncharacterized protein LOC131651132 n=1 Tax=Vicia villosa TaxID=3911 RepID=UPI00273B0694